MTICFLAELLILVLSLNFFSDYIIVDSFSTAPLMVIGLAVFQAVQLNAYSKPDNDEMRINWWPQDKSIDEELTKSAMKWQSRCRVAIIPIVLAFVFFLSGGWKCILSVFFLIASHFPVRLLVRMEQKNLKK